MTDVPLIAARLQDLAEVASLSENDKVPVGQGESALRGATLAQVLAFIQERMADVFRDGEDGRSVQMRATGAAVQWRLDGSITWLDLFPLSAVQGEKGDRGDAFNVDAQGLFSARGAYNDEPADFSYLATDEGLIYFRQGVTGWSLGIPFGKGDQGDQGDPGIDGVDGYNVELRKGGTHIEWRYAGTGGAWTPLVALNDLKGAAGSDAAVTQANMMAAISNAETFRTALGLGNAAMATVGTGAGNVAAGDDSRFSSHHAANVNFTPDATGAVARTAQNKLRDILDVRDLGIIADVTDGSRTGTDQTSALVTKLTALGVAGFRGFIRIPYGTRFTVPTVYAAVPVGVTLVDDSSINWGQPGGYKNRFRITYGSDSAADDSSTKIASSRHPALFLTNFGTGGGSEATERFGSILHSAGMDQYGDDIVGTQLLFSKANGQDRWATRLQLYTPYDIAIANPRDHAPGTIYGAGAMCLSDGGKIYETTAGGTSGVTAPTGTGTGISDGGVTWDYRAAGLVVGAVYLEVADNGSIIQASPLGETIRHTLLTNGTSVYSEYDPVLLRYTVYHGGLSAPLYEVDNGFGIRPAISFSERRLAMTGATPDAPSTGAGKVTNGGATNMTSMAPVSGRGQATINLRFDDANTTVVHGMGSNQFRLKGGVNATPPAQGFMTFEMDTNGFGGVWLEVSRSF